MLQKDGCYHGIKTTFIYMRYILIPNSTLILLPILLLSSLQYILQTLYTNSEFSIDLPYNSKDLDKALVQEKSVKWNDKATTNNWKVKKVEECFRFFVIQYRNSCIGDSTLKSKKWFRKKNRFGMKYFFMQDIWER